MIIASLRTPETFRLETPNNIKQAAKNNAIKESAFIFLKINYRLIFFCLTANFVVYV